MIFSCTAQSRINEATLVAVQQQMAQQAAFAQIPDVVKRFIVHFHQAVLDNNLAEITVAYESGWNRLTEKYYAKTEWPEAEVIAPLVNDGARLRYRILVLVFLLLMLVFWQTNCSSSSIASFTTVTSTLASSLTSTTVSIRTRTAASYSTTSSVRATHLPNFLLLALILNATQTPTALSPSNSQNSGSGT